MLSESPFGQEEPTDEAETDGGNDSEPHSDMVDVLASLNLVFNL